MVKLERKGGELIQGCDVYIGRAVERGGWDLPQSKWGNPFPSQSRDVTSKMASIQKYEQYIRSRKDLMADLEELRGKTLGCWCKVTPSTPCHGDVLIQLLSERRSIQEQTSTGVPVGFIDFAR